MGKTELDLSQVSQMGVISGTLKKKHLSQKKSAGSAFERTIKWIKLKPDLSQCD